MILLFGCFIIRHSFFFPTLLSNQGIGCETWFALWPIFRSTLTEFLFRHVVRHRPNCPVWRDFYMRMLTRVSWIRFFWPRITQFTVWKNNWKKVRQKKTKTTKTFSKINAPTFWNNFLFLPSHTFTLSTPNMCPWPLLWPTQTPLASICSLFGLVMTSSVMVTNQNFSRFYSLSLNLLYPMTRPQISWNMYCLSNSSNKPPEKPASVWRSSLFWGSTSTFVCLFSFLDTEGSMAPPNSDAIIWNQTWCTRCR